MSGVLRRPLSGPGHRALGAVGDDTWLYFTKMRAFGTPPLTAAVPVQYRYCSPGSLAGSDDVYYTRCTVPWIEVGAVPSIASATAVFAKPHFDYCKNYIRYALANKPTLNASNRAKLFWLLDVMTVGTLALIDLNIPIAPATRRGRSTASAPRSILTPFTAARDQFDQYASLARSQVYQQYRDDPARGPLVNSATLMPGPFSRLPLSWIGTNAVTARGLDAIYERIFNGYIPMAGGYRVASVGGRDGAEYLAALQSGDLPLLNAIQQWRLWCVRDGINMGSGIDATVNPLHWGPMGQQVTLGTYIDRVTRSERKTEELVLKVEDSKARLYPNLAYSFLHAPAILNPLLGMDYGQELRRHVSAWFSVSTPKADSAGGALRDSRGFLVPQPVTYTDYAAMVTGDVQRATAEARAAIKNPELGCKGNRTCLEWVRGKEIGAGISMPSYADINKAVMSSPIGPFYKAMQAMTDFLVAEIGAAVAGGRPFYPIEQPFVRSFTAADYRTIPDDTSVMVLPRILAALTNLERLTGISLCSECPGIGDAAAPASTTPTVTPRAAPVVVVDPCEGQLDAYLRAHPLVQLNMTQRLRALTLCKNEREGGVTPGSTLKYLGEFEGAAKAAAGVLLPAKKSKAVPVAAGVMAAGATALWWLRFMR